MSLLSMAGMANISSSVFPTIESITTSIGVIGRNGQALIPKSNVGDLLILHCTSTYAGHNGSPEGWETITSTVVESQAPVQGVFVRISTGSEEYTLDVPYARNHDVSPIFSCYRISQGTHKIETVTQIKSINSAGNTVTDGLTTIPSAHFPELAGKNILWMHCLSNFRAKESSFPSYRFAENNMEHGTGLQIVRPNISFSSEQSRATQVSAESINLKYYNDANNNNRSICYNTLLAIHN